MIRLAIVSSHPIQYNAPFFTALTESNRIDLKVFYTWSQREYDYFDRGFGKDVQWDVPLTQGYKYEFVRNVSRHPGTQHHRGLINPELVPKIEEFKPQALLIFGWNFISHLSVLKQFHGKIPVLFRGDSHNRNKFGIRRVLSLFLLRLVFRRVDYALYVGTWNKEYFIDAGLNENHLFHLPYPTDRKRFNTEYRNEKRTGIRSMFQIPEGGLLVFFAGKLDDNKNIVMLLNTFSRLQDGNLHLLIAGTGKYESEATLCSQRFENIHFAGFVNQRDLPTYYGASDFIILPSAGETWGMTIQEGMACGCIPLTSPGVAASADLVKPSITGLICQGTSVEDWIHLLRELPTLNLTEMRRNVEAVISNTELYNVTASFCSLLEQIIEN